MSDVVVLSDSDESVLPADDRSENVSDRKRKYDLDVNELDLPGIALDPAEDLAPRRQDFPKLNSDGHGFEPNARKCSHTMSDSCDSEADDRAERTSQTRTSSKTSKATLKEERLRRKQALARGKALKAIAQKRSKDMKPGECLRFMEVNLDRGIVAFSFQAEITRMLRNADVKFHVSDELIPNSITWRRNIEESYVGEDDETVHTERSVQAEEHVVVIWSNREAATHVAEGTFCSTVLSMKELMPNYGMILVVFGMEEYFACQKKRDKGARCKRNRQFDTFPIVSKQQLELCLTEIQIVAKCSSRLIENAEDLGLMVYQCTKAIAEIPYKLQKSENLEGKFDWYVMGDNKNTVRVDRNGNGLKRLWQQQLCQFNLSSLETAEAICTVYSSPAQLAEAYRRCTRDEGLNLLKDVPIRRAAGPLTAVRKVGPELSKKVYTMFTSRNGDTLLGAEG